MKNSLIGLNEILELFEEEVAICDVISSKCMEEVSSAIAKKRLELGLTQKQFSEYIQVSQAMVSKWEGGDYNFSIKSLAELAEKLELDLHIYLREYKKDIEVNHYKKGNLAYTTFQKNRYVGCKNVIISFEEKCNSYKKKSIENPMEM